MEKMSVVRGKIKIKRRFRTGNEVYIAKKLIPFVKLPASHG